MARGELFVQLVATFPEDPKVRRLARFGRDARAIRDLFVQMTLYCKRTLSDGFVPEDELGVLVYPDPARLGVRDANRLVEVGLCERVEGGYLLPGFLKRNPSRDQIDSDADEKRRKALLGNHRRWHIARETVAPGCPFCEEERSGDESSHDRSSDPNPIPTRSQPDRVPESGANPHRQSQRQSHSDDRRSDRDAGETNSPGPASKADLDQGFEEFWSVYPRRVAKGQAVKAWRAAIRRKIDPQHVIAAAKLYGESVRGKDPQYVAHPATWLNGQRYDDEPAAAGTVPDQRTGAPWVPLDPPDGMTDAEYDAWWRQQQDARNWSVGGGDRG